VKTDATTTQQENIKLPVMRLEKGLEKKEKRMGI
jgi:hypothetical protein